MIRLLSRVVWGLESVAPGVSAWVVRADLPVVIEGATVGSQEAWDSPDHPPAGWPA